MSKYLIIAALIITIISCATPGSPTGGLKDTVPPELLEASPMDQTTNFKDTEIRLFFSEWMKLESLEKELIITPRINTEYEHELKKQEFFLTFKEALPDSTTFTLNFRKALKDITEGNLWEDPRISFSTGPYLDSMEVSGTIVDVFTKQPMEAYTIGLYTTAYDTANLRQGEPLYFTTTDKSGYFNIRNIRNDNYLLYGFQDINDNLINESSSEPYTFYTDTLSLYDSVPPINLLSYKVNEDTLKLKKASPVGKDYKLNYNKGLANFSIQPLTEHDDSVIFAMLDNDAQDLRIFRENFPELAFQTDSLPLIITVFDSLNYSRVDSIYIKFRDSKVENTDITISKDPKTTITSGKQNFDIRFNKPVYHINYDSIFIAMDDSLIIDIDSSQLMLSDNNTHINLQTELKQSVLDTIAAVSKRLDKAAKAAQTARDSTENANTETENTETSETESEEGETKDKKRNVQKTYQPKIFLGTGSFIGIEQDSSKRKLYDINFINPETRGIIKGEVLNNEHPFIIQLLDKNFKVQDTLINKNNYVFTNVKPGEYRVRIIIDANNNRQWDSGNPLTLKEAEKIVFLEEVITVKANWELIDKNIDLNPIPTEDITVDKAVDN